MIDLDSLLSGLDRPEPGWTYPPEVLVPRLAAIIQFHSESEWPGARAALDAAAWTHGLPPPFGSQMPESH